MIAFQAQSLKVSRKSIRTVEQFKRWLKCRGLKLRCKRGDLIPRVKSCVASNILDSSIDEGKWLEAKVLKESTKGNMKNMFEKFPKYRNLHGKNSKIRCKNHPDIAPSDLSLG